LGRRRDGAAYPPLLLLSATPSPLQLDAFDLLEFSSPSFWSLRAALPIEIVTHATTASAA
jgi:hypothetical protein